MKEIFLGEAKCIMLDILKYVVGVCKANSIDYSIGEGTLIGAIRHKGFIPWDDDIDLLMDRNNFNKFLRVCSGNERYEIVYLKGGRCRYWNSVIRITDKMTSVIFDDDLHTPSYNHGLWVAIIPCDYVSDNEIEWNNDKKKLAFITRVCGHKRIKRNLRKQSFKLRFKTKGQRIRGFFASMVPLALLNKWFVKILSKYKDNPTSRVMKFEVDGTPLLFPSYLFEGGFIEKEFEGQQFKVMAHYHEYLTYYYGDYMQLPPEEDRVPKHNYKAYWK